MIMAFKNVINFCKFNADNVNLLRKEKNTTKQYNTPTNKLQQQKYVQ